jgi:hypothetical protein
LRIVELISLNGAAQLETTEFMASHTDEFGGPAAYNHDAVGWSAASRIVRLVRRPAGRSEWRGTMGATRGAAWLFTSTMARRAALALVPVALVLSGCARLVPSPGAAVSVRWTQRHPPTSPPALAGAMATDPSSGHALLFGRPDNAGILGDTWTWDGTTWTQRHPVNSPPAQGGAMAADPASGQIVLFGGQDANGTLLADTWTWDGTTWTQRHPVNSPAPRSGAAMATDHASGHPVLFGGSVNDPIRVGLSDAADTWLWDGATWVEQRLAASPPPRTAASMATDPHGRVVLFGGREFGQPLADTWTLVATTWIQNNNGQGPNGPGAGEGGAMAADPASGQVILFGGGFNIHGPQLFGGTWTWDRGTWTFENQSTEPSARAGAAIAVNSRGGLVLFGGFTVAGRAADTWTLTVAVLAKDDCRDDASEAHPECTNDR